MTVPALSPGGPIAAGAASASEPGLATGSAPSGGPPNVVLIVTDDQRWDSLWAMPEVQRDLVAPGVSFPNAFVVNPICCPSRTSILTGDYSHTTLVYRQAPPFGRYEWFRDRSTLATWLQGAGYTTALIGKYIDGYQHAALTGIVPPGWDWWVAFVHSGYYDYGLTIDGTVSRYGSSPADYSTDVLTHQAVSFIEHADGPLFLEFTPAAPHAPAIPAPQDANAFADLAPARPPSFDEADVSDKPAWVRALPRLGADVANVDAFRRDQYASLLDVDRSVDAIVTALARTGRLENTLLLFTSDNGIAYGEHRWTKKEAPYEESIRVPMVMRWDAAGWSSGDRPDALALNIDLAPTIADAVGLANTPRMDGRSLLPILAGGTDGRRDFLVEHLENVNPVPTFCAVRSRSAMYVRYATGEEELYDLVDDPYELRNLAAAPGAAELLATMRDRLRVLCDPQPPGLEGDGGGRVDLALAALAALALVEIVAARRRVRRARR
jgi:arylsulfatase A-like enzyme